MRVIILGGSGFIGRALTQALISRGDEVVVPTRHVPAATPSTGPEYQLWDGQDHSSLSQLLNGARRFRFFGDHHHPMGTFNTAGGAFGTPPVHHPDSARVGIGWRYACQAAPGVSAWAWRAGGDRKAAVRLDSS